MDAADTFQLVPLAIDPTTKLISSTSSRAQPSLTSNLSALNTLHKSLVGLDTPNQAPPPPTPIKPNRSQQIGKLRESAVAALKKNQHGEAVRHLTLAIDMALARPVWEPAQLAREEAGMLYSNRAAAHLAARSYADAMIDAELSLECKRAGNAKGHLRLAQALVEMSRRDEAQAKIAAALDVEEGALVQAGQQLEQLRAQIRHAEEQMRASGIPGQQLPPQAIAQLKAVEEAVRTQEDGVRELKELGAQLESLRKA